MLTRLDRWLGRRIMQPLIIRVCQWTGMTQYAVSRYAWMAASMTLLFGLDRHGSVAWSLFVILISIVVTIDAALCADRPTGSHDWLRFVVLIMTAIDFGFDAARLWATGNPHLDHGDAWDALALIGEYALTIRTIPPREVKRRALRGKLVRAS